MCVVRAKLNKLNMFLISVEVEYTIHLTSVQWTVTLKRQAVFLIWEKICKSSVNKIKKCHLSKMSRIYFVLSFCSKTNFLSKEFCETD